ncbi:MAG: TM2 domain-containing protein [Nocardioides sp.]|jgi:TM2 domain-containing membrane protein YozV
MSNQGPEYPSEPNQPEGGESPYGTPTPPSTPPSTPPPPPYGEPAGSVPPPPPSAPPYGAPQPGQAPYATFGAPAVGMPGAPYGVHPVTGIPYSDKSKVVAGLLQILVPFGIGRFYIGDSGIGVAQLLVTIFTCGIGALWPVIDGIIMLASDSKDANGLMLRS